MVPALGSNFKSKNMQGSTQYFQDWFNRIGQPDIQSMMSKELQQSYKEANDLYLSGRNITPAEFYQNYASEANQPTPAQPKGSFLASFVQHAKGNSIGSIMGNGLKGALSIGAKGLLSGAAGDVVGAEAGGLAGAGSAALMGEMLGGPITALVGGVLSLIGGQVTAGMKNWQQTAPAFSSLTHSLGESVKSLESFRIGVQMAGATTGMTLEQSTQAAQSFAQTFSGMNPSKLSALVAATGQAAMYNGLTPEQMTQITSTAGNLGITAGRGAQLTPLSFDEMLANGTQAAGMQGRQAPFYSGLMSLYSSLGATNPIITNQVGVASQYAALNASGIEGLQGNSGAQLMATVDKGMANAQGIQQLLGFSAIMKASGGRITDPFQMMSIMEQGTAAKVGNTTLGAAYTNEIKGLTNNPYAQAAMFGNGLDINQAMAMIKANPFAAKNLSTQNRMKTPFSTVDVLNVGNSEMAVENSRAGNLLANISAGLKSMLGSLPTGLTAGGKQYFMSANGSITSAPVNPMIPTNNNWNPNDTGGIYNTRGDWSQQQFIKTMMPYAVEVQTSTGIPATDILGQWAKESKWGNSAVAVENGNFAGINPNRQYSAGAESGYAGYSSLQQFAQNDIQVLKSNTYKKALALAKSGASATKIFTELSKEGYNGANDPSLYGSTVSATADSVQSIIAQNGMGNPDQAVYIRGGTVSLSKPSINSMAQAILDVAKALNRGAKK
jgi:flagellum-specific peptidoglycan hydrolase FlgJ